ncbi:hypothetical protein [Novosphingobium sp. HII-3]|uniref:hypothetical protein n=1 Tax=Novosphingobium sp. HII-3 TaxID=2075565 RepID=UPI000CDB50D7|nr:hypothetical protein [Novosphingobium sp. HII-3]
MSCFHPLASDADAADAEVGNAEGACAWALGRLDGLIASLSAIEAALFGAALLRETLLHALLQAGFEDAQLRFDHWFCGLEREPQQTAISPCPAPAIVRALLSDLRHHPWAPLADAATTVAAAARFTVDRFSAEDDRFARNALVHASDHVDQVCPSTITSLPFESLLQLVDQLGADPLFASAEKGLRTLPLGERQVTIEQAAAASPLWAVEATMGKVLQAGGSWCTALPCPGAMTAEALQPHLWPGERRMVLAHNLKRTATRLADLLATAKAQAARMHSAIGHLRSNARAPHAWNVLAGFAPLGVEQMVSAFGVSRRGTYAIADALVGAGLARRHKVKGMVLLVAIEPHEQPSPRDDALSPSLAPALAEFDAAMAAVDALLVQSNCCNLENSLPASC